MRKYRVQGFCLAPCEAGIEIEADSAEEAMQQAHRAWDSDKSSLIDPNGVDAGAAFDWQPSVSEI